MNSSLYECNVMHHRLWPKQHHFSYRLFMMYLDLDEIGYLARRVPLFSLNRLNLFSFYDSDHVPDSKGSTKDKLIAYLNDRGVSPGADWRVMLLTLPRVLNYVFNPVSFYFCFDAAGAPQCAVAEVGNTFHEKKLYLLRDFSGANQFRLLTPKHFYVSPFSALDLDFEFKLAVPAESLSIHVDDWRADERVLLSALTGRREPLTATRLAWFIVKYPCMTVWIIFLIHWHALLLWLKRIPVHAKEQNTSLQREVLHPHATITGGTP